MIDWFLGLRPPAQILLIAVALWVVVVLVATLIIGIQTLFFHDEETLMILASGPLAREFYLFLQKLDCEHT
jgi:hypothetical protein